MEHDPKGKPFHSETCCIEDIWILCSQIVFEVK